MHRCVSLLAVWLIVCEGATARAEDGWKAGAARVQITPAKSIWLTGFGARTAASKGKLQELYVKALALEDPAGRRAVLITSDLLGFPAVVSDRICGEAAKRFGLSRDRILLNSSHTHGAPALASPAHFIYGPRATPAQQKDIEEYTRKLEDDVVELIGRALGKLEAAKLSFGQGEAFFGVNRRLMTPAGIKGFTPNPNGPVDHAVPVLRVDSEAGRMLAVVFGYAAHPTTITGGEHYYHYSGDYVGFAQQFLEADYSDAVALFVQGCGGDVMVSPRGTVELARQYGDDLRNVVNETLKKPLTPVGGTLKTAYETVTIDFGTPPTRAALEEQLKTGDLYFKRHAQEMLAILDRGESLPKNYPYPLQAWQFGNDLTLVAMAGEVVSEYSLRLKKELDGRLWVAGYSNDLCCYIASKRVVEEGGYEGDRSMIYYMQPGPWSTTIEDAIVGKVHELVERVRSK